MPKNKKEKEAETLNVQKHIDGDMEITTTIKKIDKTTDFLLTPCGTKVNANDLLRVFEEYYSLPDEDKKREKETWIELIGSMIGQKGNGLKIVDIELSSSGSKEIKLVYR